MNVGKRPVPVPVGPPLSVPLPGTGKGAEVTEAEGKSAVPTDGDPVVTVMVKEID